MMSTTPNPTEAQAASAVIARLSGPTAALNVSLGRLAAEYFSVAEDLGIPVEGIPSSHFWLAVGRLLPHIAREMISDGIDRSETDLIAEYLSAIRDGAYAKRTYIPTINLN